MYPRAPPPVEQIVILILESSKMSLIDAVLSLLNGNPVSICTLTAPPVSDAVHLGEFMAKTVEEDLTRLLAPSTTGTSTTEGSTVIRT